MFSIPVTFGMNMVYCAVLAKVLRNFDRLYAFLYVPSLIVLGIFVVEVVLLVSLGAVSSRAIVGPAFYVVHLLSFFLVRQPWQTCWSFVRFSANGMLRA